MITFAKQLLCHADEKIIRTKDIGITGTSVFDSAHDSRNNHRVPKYIRADESILVCLQNVLCRFPDL